jgi:lipopolysaccharide heptosyltransferase II
MDRLLTTTLIIRFSSVGDIVLTSPLIRTLRTRFPHCRIDFLVKEDHADLIRHNPHLTQILTLPRGGGLDELRRIRTHIRSSRYDAILDMHDNLRSRFLTFGTTPVLRYRKRRIARFVLINAHLDIYRFAGGALPMHQRYIEPLAPYGVVDDGAGPEVFVTREIGTSADSILTAAGLPMTMHAVGVCPSAWHATKMWDAERFAAAAATLAGERGVPVILFGSQSEAERCERIAGRIRAASPSMLVINTAGRCTLLETAAAMDRCAIVLTNDTGLMHLAASRKRPLVAVFGPTVRQFGFFPHGEQSMVVEHSGLSCRPCTGIGMATCPKGHFRCMTDIEPPRVVEAARSLLH